MGILPKPYLVSRGIPLSHVRMSSSKPAATIQSLDHLVLTVKSIPDTTKWYTTNLGMRSESFISDASPEVTRHSLIFGSQKINLHESGKVHFLLLHAFRASPPHNYLSSKYSLRAPIQPTLIHYTVILCNSVVCSNTYCMA